MIGSMTNASTCNSSSVIAVYWPSRCADISEIDYSHTNIGRVQYFLKHQATFCGSGEIAKRSEHIFAYVAWNQHHLHPEWFGISANVCLIMYESLSMCSFKPVQQIHALCAHCELDIEIDGLKENVFVAIPVPMKFSL